MENHPALCRVIDVYGGLSLWRKLKGVVLQILSLGGPLLVAKGLGRTFLRPTIVTVDPLHWRVEFHDFPQPGESAIFSRGRVQLLSRAGALALDRPSYRENFSSISKYRRWSHADAVYFFGYALSTYLSIPFILAEHAISVREWKQGIRVAARFPQDLDTHSSAQVFWFNHEGLLVRHDYRAEIVGWWAAGAHFTSAYRTIAGLPVATRRQVYARLFRTVTPVPVLSATLDPLELKLA